MEFEEFSRQFRQRTTRRMIEFEKALAQAQARVEKAVTSPPPTSQPHAEPSASTQQRPRPGAARGRVQGLLRKG